MNLDFLTQHPDLNGISKEKMDFIIAFATEPRPNSTQELSTKFMQAMAKAKHENINFNQKESAVLIDILKEQLPPEDKKRADKLISLMRNFQPQKR